MATFLFVHGAWHTGWSFDHVVALLEEQGHRALAPDLPVAADGSATLEAWADHVIDTARSEKEPVLLCGHSRGGIVISTAAEKAPERIRALVYIAAFMLPDGESLFGFRQKSSDVSYADALTQGTAGVVQMDADAAAEIFYNRTSAESARLACNRLVPEPMGPMTTTLVLSPARFGSVPRYYVECLDDRAIPVGEQRAMQAMLPPKAVETLDTDHSPFLSCPEALVAAILRCHADAEACPKPAA